MILARYRNPLVTSDPHLSEGQINDLVDGLVHAAEHGEIDGHLAQCEACSHEISRLAELVAASRADAEMVVAPLFLQPLVLATTIHERVMRRWMVRAIRRPVIVGVITVVAVSSMLTGWVLLACPDRRGHTPLSSPNNGRPSATPTFPIQCTEPWYFVVREAARERYKELRNRERDDAKRLIQKQRR